MLKRTYEIDIFVCARCQGPTRVIAVIEDDRVARRILEHLGLPAAPPRGRPWRPGKQTLAFDFDGIDMPPISE